MVSIGSIFHFKKLGVLKKARSKWVWIFIFGDDESQIPDQSQKTTHVWFDQKHRSLFGLEMMCATKQPIKIVYQETSVTVVTITTIHQSTHRFCAEGKVCIDLHQFWSTCKCWRSFCVDQKETSPSNSHWWWKYKLYYSSNKRKKQVDIKIAKVSLVTLDIRLL